MVIRCAWQDITRGVRCMALGRYHGETLRPTCAAAVTTEARVAGNLHLDETPWQALVVPRSQEVKKNNQVILDAVLRSDILGTLRSEFMSCANCGRYLLLWLCFVLSFKSKPCAMSKACNPEHC